MIETLSPGMNIYYRGYLIHEDIRSIYYTVYGVRPDRAELTGAGTSREAMEWIDRQIAGREPQNLPHSLIVWPTLFSTMPVPAFLDS